MRPIAATLTHPPTQYPRLPPERRFATMGSRREACHEKAWRNCSTIWPPTSTCRRHPASPLPPDAYLSPELNELEVRTIFERSWLCVGREEYAPEPGDYYTIDVMGEPVVIVRGADGVVRALNTACRHRAMPVVSGRGNARRFVCPYHAWVYATDGRLIAAPHMEGSGAFSKAQCSLPEYRLENWKGFLFVNLDDDAQPLQASMASMDQATRSYRIEDQTEVFHYETTWHGNWKLSAENSMEYYHHCGLHARTVGVQMPAKGTYFPDHPPSTIRTRTSAA